MDNWIAYVDGVFSGKDIHHINELKEEDLLVEPLSREIDPSTGLPVPCKWKKLARNNKPKDSSMTQTVLSKRNRGEEESMLPELSNKKF